MKIKLQSLGYLEGWLSTIINIILFAFKYWVGQKYNSISMKADAWHTLSDTLTSIIIIFGFWMAAQKADYKHPFGYGRAEPIATVIIGTLLAVVGFNFLIESITRLQNVQSAYFGKLAIIVFLTSVLIKEGLAQFSIWAGGKIKSQALIADGWHHRSDAIASGLIVLGALFGHWWLDGILGIFISLLILYVSYGILKRAISILLGEKYDKELEIRVKKLVKKTVSHTCNVHHLHLHKYGDHMELTFHIKLPSEMNLKESHDVATLLENKIRTEMNIETTIHIEPA
ncbi:MAG: cation diffusion facilitator family transporter [Halobacteriota archaeon]